MDEHSPWWVLRPRREPPDWLILILLALVVIAIGLGLIAY